MVDLLRRNIAEYRFYLVDWGESLKKIKGIAIDQHKCHGMGRGYFFGLIWLGCGAWVGNSPTKWDYIGPIHIKLLAGFEISWIFHRI